MINIVSLKEYLIIHIDNLTNIAICQNIKITFDLIFNDIFYTL